MQRVWNIDSHETVLNTISQVSASISSDKLHLFAIRGQPIFASRFLSRMGAESPSEAQMGISRLDANHSCVWGADSQFHLT